MTEKLKAAAQALASHFKALEAKRGEPFQDAFKNPMLNGAWSQTTVGIPPKLLRDLVDALAEDGPSGAPAITRPTPAECLAMDQYCGR